jgi:hypothetical protein
VGDRARWYGWQAGKETFPTVVLVVPANGSWPCLMRMALSRWVELVELPSLVEPRLERSVEAEQHEPGLAGQGLDPVRLLTLGRGGAEVQVVGAVGVGLELAGAAGQGRPDGRGDLGERAGLGVVDVHGPEVLGRRVQVDVHMAG